MASDPIRVRMYEVGFGDCFLIDLPSADGPRKILVDCGSIKGGSKPFKNVVEQLLKDLEDTDGIPRVDVVVATHRHRDHIEGFARDEWDDVEVGEVWLPWTEDEADPQAARIRERQIALANRLGRALALGPDLLRLSELVGNALANDAAMSTLRDGFRRHRDHGTTTRRIYLPNRKMHRTLASRALPGVTVYVMGPSRDAADIKYMEPRADDDHYLRLAGELAGGEQIGALFPSDWTDDPTPDLALSAQEREHIANLGTGLEAAATSWLDQALNNTSLMLMLQIGKAHLLLPGDSQWGTWMRVLGDSQWHELLRKTRLYKVGHHGSYNATPPDFVDDYLRSDALSLCSVVPHGSYKKVPKNELLQALADKHRRVIRSDKPPPAARGTRTRAGVSIEVEIPTD